MGSFDTVMVAGCHTGWIVVSLSHLSLFNSVKGSFLFFNYNLVCVYLVNLIWNISFSTYNKLYFGGFEYFVMYEPTFSMLKYTLSVYFVYILKWCACINMLHIQIIKHCL